MAMGIRSYSFIDLQEAKEKWTSNYSQTFAYNLNAHGCFEKQKWGRELFALDLFFHQPRYLSKFYWRQFGGKVKENLKEK